MIISTWNVLHGIHAANWGEAQAALDEAARVEAIARRVDELLAFSVAVCLQEVSGDQLRALRARHVWSMAYPRVPTVRPGSAQIELDDPTEHLVVLSSLLPGEVVSQRTFPDNPGKGFLSVRLGNGLVVVSTHVSYRDTWAEHVQALAAHARAQQGRPVAIAGDFNADRATVMAALGQGFSAAAPPPGRHTRPRAEADGKSQDIDHVIGHFAAAGECGVEDGRGLSDHNPVWTKFV